MAQRGRRVYHGRRRTSPLLWLIALLVLIAAVVLVVLGLGKEKPADPDSDPQQTVEKNDPTPPSGSGDDAADPADTGSTDDPEDGQPVSTEPYIDSAGLLQYSTVGHYVQADSYQGGGEAPWELLLVNDWNPLPAGYDDDVTFASVSGGKQVDSRILDAVERMLSDGAAYDLAVVSAYRPQEEQDTLYWRKVKQYTDQGYSDLEAQKVGGTIVKRPGFSEHNCGLAMDVGGSGDYTLEQTFANTEAYAWLMEHCADYGFILRFPEGKEDITGVIYEPWHYRYVGVETARYIMDNDLCLEEYLQQVKK